MLQKGASYIGHVSMLVLIFLSVYFYQEKMLHTDNAYGALALINTNEFIIPHYRYPLVITQILPLLAIKLGLSLKFVLIAFSASFYLIYYLCFLLVNNGFKNVKAGLLILFTVLVTTSEVFFLQTELLHGLVFGVTFYAWFYYTEGKKITSLVNQFLGVLLLLIALLFHPISALFVLFLLIWIMIETNNYSNKKIYLYLLLAVVVLVVKTLLTPANSYEGGFLQMPSFYIAFMGINKSYSLGFFVKRLQGLYLLPTILLLVSLIWLGYKKQFLQAAYLLISAVGYLLFIAIFIKGDSDIMMERVFLPYGLIASIGLVSVFVNQPKSNLSTIKSSFLMFALIGVIVAGIVKISEASLIYSHRLSLVNQQAEKAQQAIGTKFYVFNSDVPYPFGMWANACEQILYSALHFPNNIKTVFIFDDDTDAKNTLNSNPETLLLTRFYLVTTDNILNKTYFNLAPNTYKYLILK